MRTASEKNQCGFTLIELIVVILVIGILAALGGKLIVAPVKGYTDLARRTRLVDQAEMALRRMQRDIRHALPNSIRVDGSGHYLELINTLDGGRYRAYLDGTTGDILDFDAVDLEFDVLGDLSRVPNDGDSLIIYNVTSSGTVANAYAGTPDNRALIGSVSASGSSNSTSHLVLSSGFKFAHRSPYQRFYLSDGPVTYGCVGGSLMRYDGYGFNATQPTPASGGAQVTSGVTGCSFSYDPGASQRAGLVTLELTLSEEGETITLLHQVHVVNVP